MLEVIHEAEWNSSDQAIFFHCSIVQFWCSMTLLIVGTFSGGQRSMEILTAADHSQLKHFQLFVLQYSNPFVGSDKVDHPLFTIRVNGLLVILS